MRAPRTTVRCILFASGIGVLAIVGVFDVAAAPAGATAAKASPTSPASTASTHTVLRGQTLYSIARSYGVPVRSLAAANGIRNPSRVRTGARLVIPASGSPSPGRSTRSPRPPRPARPAVKTSPVAPPAVPAVAPLPHKEEPAPGEDEGDLPPAAGPASPGPGETFEPPLDRLVWPVDGPVLSGFDRPRRGHRHRGIDIGSVEGTPIHAVAAGVVTLATDHFGNYGRLVVIEHEDGLVSYYGHNMRNLVETGQRVEADEVIGLVGHTGNASCNHVHFELRYRGEPVDPVTALAPRAPATAATSSAMVGGHR